MNRQIVSTGFIICALIMCGPILAQQEEKLTITTYYPSPTGVYNTLLTKTLGVGDTNADGSFNSNDIPNPTADPGSVWIAGNVTIGTNTTTAGNVTLVSNSSVQLRIMGGPLTNGNLHQLRFLDNTTGKEWFFYTRGAAYPSPPNGAGFVFFNNTLGDSNYGNTANWGGTPIAMTPLGYVGIGTTSPSSMLNVRTNTTNDGISLADGDQGHFIKLLAGTTGMGSYNGIVRPQDNALIFGNGTGPADTEAFVIAPWASTTSGMRMDTNGNVGIGTSSPGANLTVVDPVTGSGVKIAEFLSPLAANGDTNYIRVGRSTTGDGAAFGYKFNSLSNVAGGFIGDFSGNPQLFVNGLGNVGIGTTTPDELLQVGNSTTIGTDMFYVHTNNHGNMPATGFGLKVGTNFSGGQGEVNFWNSWASALRSFAFYQRTASGNTKLMEIHPDGDLTIYGDIATKSGGANTWATSDARLKKNVQPLKNALDKISELQGVTYEWKNPVLHVPGRRAGVTGQDLKKVFPDWVKYMEPEGEDITLIPEGEKALMVGFPGDFNAYVIEAFKELRATVTEQKKRIESLELEIRALKAR